MSSLKRSTVTIPCADVEVDYTPFAAIVHHPEFQILRRRKQLGEHVPRVFPGGEHSRYEHSLGVYHYAGRVIGNLIKAGCVDKTQKNVLLCYALLHDVGHGPMSHGIEPVTEFDHKRNGARVLRLFEPELDQVGVPVNRLLAMLEKRDPLGAIISDKRVGADLLDYLQRDAHHTGKRVADVSPILGHLVYEDNHLGIDHTVTQETIRLLHDYCYMYQRVYLGSTCRLFERITARMVELLLEHGELNEEELWRMTDSELEGAFEHSGHEGVRFLYGKYRANVPMETVFVICPPDTGRFQEFNGAGCGVIHEFGGCPEQLLLRGAHKKARQLELEAELLLDLPRYSVIVVPPIEKRRFAPGDVPVSSHGRRRSLRELYPQAFDGIENIYRHDAGFRLCVWSQYRELAAKRSDDLIRMAEKVLPAV